MAEQFFARLQKEISAQHSADDARRDDEPQSFFLSAQIIALCESPAEVAGTERDGVRHIRSDRWDSQKDEHRKGDQCPAACEGVDRACDYGGETGEEELNEHEAKYSIERVACWLRGGVVYCEIATTRQKQFKG